MSDSIDIDRIEEIALELDEFDALNLTAKANFCHRLAAAKGWWDEPRTFGDICALIHSEVSEALEEHREGHEPAYVYQTKNSGERREGFFLEPGNSGLIDPQEKPEGIAIEFADVLIRILDYCGKHDIDISAAMRWKLRYNLGREHRHGGKRL